MVIGIIALLISILLPALNRARQQAQSVACASDMHQIGIACLLYVQDNHGQYPLAELNGTIERFHEYTTSSATNPNNPNPSAVRDAIARYLGTKVPAYPAPAGSTYVSPDVAVLYCPVALSLGLRLPPASGGWNAVPSNFLAEGTSSPASEGKFLYWYVANPYDENTVPTTYSGNADLAAAAYWYHMETGVPVADTTRPCIPGIDYLRTTSDHNAATVAILVDQSRQEQATGGGWFWMHGGSTSKNKGWKNELYGDGHVQSVMASAVISRWGLSNPAGW